MIRWRRSLTRRPGALANWSCKTNCCARNGRSDILGQPEVVEMSRTVSTGIGKPYGLERVYRGEDSRVRRSMPLVRARRATWCHWWRSGAARSQRCPTDLLNAIRADLAASQFIGEGYAWYGRNCVSARYLGLPRPGAASDAGERLGLATSTPLGQVCTARRHDHDEPPEQN
jgi:hypothetical protein